MHRNGAEASVLKSLGKHQTSTFPGGQLEVRLHTFFALRMSHVHQVLPQDEGLSVQTWHDPQISEYFCNGNSAFAVKRQRNLLLRKGLVRN